jgi:hypothetical protein
MQGVKYSLINAMEFNLLYIILRNVVIPILNITN